MKRLILFVKKMSILFLFFQIFIYAIQVRQFWIYKFRTKMCLVFHMLKS